MYKSPVGDAIVDNTATIALFRHKSEAIETLKDDKKLVMPDGAYSLLRTVHTLPPYYSEIFIKGETGIGVGRLVVSDYSKLLYSTDPVDKSAIKRYRDQGLSFDESIRRVLRDRGKGV
jgi:conjugal transfer ATP-binding protein TraC